MNEEALHKLISQAREEGLTSLDLSGQGLTSLPAEIGQLVELRELYLENNRLTNLPSELGQLRNLRTLNVENNQITVLPAAISDLTGLAELRLRGNPLPIPPEILAFELQPSEIIDYNRQSVRKSERRPLNEAKLVVLGDGGVGKTSLVRRLIHGAFNEKESTTQGISIQRWALNIDNRPLRLNIWDFGGQEILHSAHASFLTRRSIYLLVLDARRGAQGNNVDYWLKLIQTYGGDSPVIVVNNQADLREPSLDRVSLRLKYPTIEAFVDVSALSGSGLDTLREQLKRVAGELGHIKYDMPLSWFVVRGNLSASGQSYLDYSDYAHICATEGIADQQSQAELLTLLSDLGDVVYFSDDARLRDSIVIKPEWIIIAIYRLLSSPEVRRATGLFRIEQIKNILDPVEYPADKHAFLIAVIERFGLGFALAETGQFLFPALLSDEQPEVNWDDRDTLVFRYRYSFMPEAMITSFIVRAHQFIAPGIYWRNGAFIKDRGCQAMVKADREQRTFTIQIAGATRARRSFMSRFREQFEYLHRAIPNLEVEAEVPLPEYPEQFVNYDYLLKLARLGEETFVSTIGLERINIKQLLDNYAPGELKTTDKDESAVEPDRFTRRTFDAWNKLSGVRALWPVLLSVIVVTGVLSVFGSEWRQLLSSRPGLTKSWQLALFVGAGLLGALLPFVFFTLRARSNPASQDESFFQTLARISRLFFFDSDKAIAAQRETYPVWAEQIMQSLLDTNSVDFKKFPRAQRSFIFEQFSKDHKHLSISYNEDDETLEVSELNRLNEFRRAWSEARSLVVENRIDPFRLSADRLTELLSGALNFTPRAENTTQNQLYGHMIDATNAAFDLKIREDFPFVFAAKRSFTGSEPTDVTGILNRFRISSNYFALLVSFFDAAGLRRVVRDSVYKDKFIVLDHDEIWEILAAKSSVGRLKNLILERVDLTTLSPYETAHAVSGNTYFGRAEEESRILGNISDTNFALLANRKVGKTSLINRVVPRLKRLANLQVIDCDLQAAVNYETFYAILDQTLRTTEWEMYSVLTKPIGPEPVQFRSLIEELKLLNSNRQIVFVFDEVDALLGHDLNFDEQLFKTFRSLATERVRFIFSGTRTLVERVRNPDSPFFNFCQPLKIGRLDENAARDLVTIPMRGLNVGFENEVAAVTSILSISERHPNIIQWICDKLIRRINENQRRVILTADIEAVLGSDDFYTEIGDLIWGETKDVEVGARATKEKRARLRLVVYAMWNYDRFTLSEVQGEFTRRGLPTTGISESIKTLEIYSILTREAETYHFTYREFKKLIDKHEDIATLYETARDDALKGGPTP